jgi:excisionase family DNA binding protein
MSELLTTRELQNLLKVDRITIYRMLEQGRLPGFKVGGQWRFARRQIDEWLEAQRDSLSSAEGSFEESQPISVSPLPLHCVQSMQNIFADALDVAAVTTDLAGEPLTAISNSCEFCNLVLSTSQGFSKCAQSWRPMSGIPGAIPQSRFCHAGLLCASVVVKVGGEPVAGFASCQGRAAQSARATEDWEAGLSGMAAGLGLDETALRAAAQSIQVLSDAEQARLFRLLHRMATTLSDIGQERLTLLSRLRSIAEMTKV